MFILYNILGIRGILVSPCSCGHNLVTTDTAGLVLGVSSHVTPHHTTLFAHCHKTLQYCEYFKIYSCQCFVRVKSAIVFFYLVVDVLRQCDADQGMF